MLTPLAETTSLCTSKQGQPTGRNPERKTKMKTEITLSLTGLPSTPAAPLKGHGFKRENWNFRNVGLAAAAYASIPAAHKDTIAVRSRLGGHFSSTRIISPEAAKALKEIMALLEAKSRLAFLEERAAEAAKVAAEKAKHSATLAAIGGSEKEVLASWKDAGFPHPAPEAVYALKAKSGLGWKAFQNAI